MVSGLALAGCGSYSVSDAAIAVAGLVLVLLLRFSGASELVHRSRIPAAPASEGEMLSVFPSLVLWCLAWHLQGW